MTFENQVILITGATGNLGRALVNALADSGAKLALFDYRIGQLSALYPDLDSQIRHLFVEGIDLSEQEAVRRGIDQVIDHFGRIDIVINAAGGYAGGDPVDQTSVELWDHMMDLNARSVFLVSRLVIPLMRNQGSGSIVNIAARPGIKGRKNAGAYSASKSAVLRLTESISAEVKQDGIRVNTIIPGTMDTPENRAAMPGANHSRWVEPAAVADAILFLASDKARGICGASIPVLGPS
jgi:NAD(P)-dependent dehydrogenase (short-subunit alcohol dehydrogenase family)